MKKHKQLIAGLAFLTLGSACIAGVNTIWKATAERTESLFYSDGVEFSTRQKSPNAGLSDKYGLLLSANRSGASAVYANEVIGNFDIDFSVYSKTSYSGDCTSVVYENDYADLRELTFKFTDLSDEDNAFEVVLVPGYAGNCVTPTARVRAKGVEAGIVSEGNVLQEQTAVSNSEGIYTPIEGASFSNLAYANGQLTDYVQAISLSFDPNEMCIYVKADGGMKYLVWNFSNAVNDAKDIGFTLNGMEKYSVTIEFSDVTEDRDANMLVYSIGGRDVSWHYLENDKRVGMSIESPQNGVVGRQYEIPIPVCSENLKSASVEVIGPLTTDTFKDCTKQTVFTPQFSGIYSLVYHLVSSDGVKSSYEYKINIFDELPASSFYSSSILYEGDYGVGSCVSLPYVTVSGGLLNKEQPAKLSVFYNDELLKNYDAVVSYDSQFKFTKEGTYKVIFAGGGSEKTYVFNIETDLPEFASYAIPPDVALNETFVVPKWTITENGKICAYTVKIKKPDGTAVSGEQILANQLGTYEIEFTVAYGNNDSAVYKRYFNVRQKTSESIYSDEFKITSEVGSAWYNSNINGVIVSANSSFSAVYRNEIDLTNNTKDDLLVEVAVLAEKIREENFSELLLTFTDIEDDSNYFAIDILTGDKSGEGKSVSYVKAGATNQLKSGWLDGSKNRLFSGGNYGTYTHFSFSGVNSGESNKTLKFYYDNEEKAIYVCFSGNSKIQIVDFDDPECFSSPWKGLTNGKVKFTVQTLGYNSGKASVVVKTVNGFSMNGEYLVENEKPLISVNTQGYQETDLPCAVIGKKYPLFTAAAYSKLQGMLKCGTEVYLNYGENNQEQIDVSNGFIPTKTGTYTIVYKTEDGYGTSNLKTLEIYCISESSYREISADISEADNIAVFMGRRTKIKMLAAQGGQGKLRIETTLYDCDGAMVALDEENSFVPTKTGRYRVVYLVTDYLGTKKNFSYAIDCSISDKPIINDEVYLPSGFIRNYTYELPELIGYDYFDNGAKKKVNVQIYILDEKGNNLISLGADRKFLPRKEYGEKVIVRYFVGGERGFVLKDYAVDIYDVVNENEEVDKTKLFVTSGISNISANEGYVSFEVNQTSKISFINNLVDNNTVYGIGASLSDESQTLKARVYLTDAENQNIRLYYNVEFGKNGISVAFENGKSVSVSDVALNEKISCLFSYRRSDNTLRSETGTLLLSFTETLSGKTFAGFPSGKVRIDFAFSDLNSVQTFLIYDIGGFSIDSGRDDFAAPQINFLKDIQGYGLIGNQVYVPAAVVADAVDPNAKVLVSVQLKGKYIKDINGEELKNSEAAKAYRFIPETVGNYLVTYYYYDSFGNSNEYRKSISITEKVPPKITVDGRIKAQMKVNEQFTIPGFIVSDNVTAEEKIIKTVYMISPTGSFEKADGSYVFKETGVYTLRYVAFDEAMNYTILDFKIEVVK